MPNAANGDPADSTLPHRSCVLFDLDGTLVDSVPDLTGAVNAMLADDGCAPLSLDEVRAMVGDGARVLVERARAERGLDAGSTDEALERFRTAYSRRLCDETTPYPGIDELLADLASAGRRLAVVTNKPEDFARRVLDGLGLAERFAAVVGPESATARKPSPEHVRAALDALGVPAGDAVLVGDGTTDVAAGRDAGCLTIAVLWGYRGRADLAPERPDAFAGSVEELRELLLR